MKSSLLVLAVLWSVVGLAAEPRAVISEVTPSVEVGDLVVIDGSESVGTGHRWRVYGIAAKQWILVDGGKRLVLAAKGTSLIRVTLTVGAVAEGDLVVLADAEIEIAVAGGGGGGDEPPPPKPDANKYGMKSVIEANAKLVTGEKQLAASIASNYRRVGELAMSGKLDVRSGNGNAVDVGATVNAMSTAVGAANATLPDSARPAWRPILLKVNEAVDAICNRKDSPVATTSNAGEMYVEIADAIAKIIK